MAEVSPELGIAVDMQEDITWYVLSPENQAIIRTPSLDTAEEMGGITANLSFFRLAT